MTIPNLELWRTFRRTSDPALRDRLIEADLALVKYVAARIASRLPKHLRLDDLYSAGLLGYLAAVDDFDPERGVAFAAYAGHRVRGAIFDELRRLDWVPRGVRERMRDTERAIDNLFQRLDRQPTDEEVARELGVEVEAYRAGLADGVTLVSLSATVTPDGEGPALTDSIEDNTTADPLLALAEEERREILGRLIDALPDRERQVLSLYYYEELTMREVGAVLGVTESRVSQLHSSAIHRLNVLLRRRRLGARELELPKKAFGASRTARGIATILLLGLGAAALTACASSRSARPAPCLPSGRGLVVARVPSEDNRATAEVAAERLAYKLRKVTDVVSSPELLAEARQAGLGLWASSTVGRVQRGGRSTPEDVRLLVDSFGITSLVVTDLTEFGQIWGKYGKFTRATLEGEGFDLVGEAPLWRLRGHAEVEDMRGRAFTFVMDEAVKELAQGICPQPHTFSLTELWRSWRR